MAFFCKTGSFYSISYSRWKTNPDKIYLFVLFGNPVLDKIHALNIGARQLSAFEKAKIVHTIVRLSKVPSASKYTGQILYRILNTYLKNEIKKCYRTYFHSAITRASLINYGLNKKEDFSEQDFKVYNPSLLQEARADMLVRLLNIYTLRGFDVQDMQESLAKIQAKIPTGQPPLATSTTPIPAQPASSPQLSTKPTSEPLEPTQPKESGTPDDFSGTGYD